ncbi:MAG: hypothetical protein F6J93_34120 [Oscillatoria sp. SIO1A7]|nr:hypothetical protein [Oscillatoria sp. SIO1A7]
MGGDKGRHGGVPPPSPSFPLLPPPSHSFPLLPTRFQEIIAVRQFLPREALRSRRCVLSLLIISRQGNNY